MTKYLSLLIFILLVECTYTQTWNFTDEWQAGQFDSNNNWTGGTELLNIRAHKGQLFATTGYWNDLPGTDPTSGPHILIKKDYTAEWETDITFDALYNGNNPRHLLIVALESIIFTKDTLGNPLPVPDTLLIAGVYDALGLGLRVRDDDSGAYNNSVIYTGSPDNGNIYNIIRCMKKYTDPTSGGEFLYIGSWSEIYKGWYDSNEPTKIKFQSTPVFSFPTTDTWVASMTIANGKLYAGCGPEDAQVGGIWEKDLASDNFSLIFSLPFPGNVSVSNPRGLTTIPDPLGNSHDVILFAYEGNGDIIRIDPMDSYNAVVELNVKDYFDALPNTFTTNLAAYNDMLVFDNIHIIGVAMTNTTDNQITTEPTNNGTYFLMRNADASYDHHYVYDYVNQVENGLNLRSVRTICASPFEEDEEGTIYLGGFDAAGGPHHNTAWMYKGQLTEVTQTINIQNDNSFLVYPNPFKKEICFVLNGQNQNIQSLKVYNTQGVLVLNILNNTDHCESFPMLPSGAYILALELQDGKIVYEKIIKQ